MLREILTQAWHALRRHPSRSLLTMLGIRSVSGHAHSEAFPEVAHRLGSAAALR